jgi:hypothetical protein
VEGNKKKKYATFFLSNEFFRLLQHVDMSSLSVCACARMCREKYGVPFGFRLCRTFLGLLPLPLPSFSAYRNLLMSRVYRGCYGLKLSLAPS